MLELIISLFLTLSPVTVAKAQVNRHEFQQAVQTLDGVPLTRENYNDYCYVQAVSHFQLNHQKEAAKWVRNLEDSWEPLPRRYEAVAALMAADLPTWRPDDLGDIGRDMRAVTDRLGNARGGPTTQKAQKDIVAKLDKLIKHMEDELKKQQEQQEQQAQVQSQSNNTAQPLPDSQVQNTSGPGEVSEKRLRHLAQGWGKLPEKERVRAMADLTRDMPPQYREVIERYFKDIAASTGR